MSTFTLENKTNQTVPAAADILPIVDVSDSNQLNKITVQNLLASTSYTNIQAGTSAGVIIKNNGGTDVLTIGAGGGTGVTAAGQINASDIQAGTSAGVIIKNNGGTDVLTIGAGGGTGVTAAGQINASGINFGNETMASFRENVAYTPIVQGDTTAGTNTYSVQEGVWHRISSKIAFISVDVGLVGAINSTGSISVNLPFSGLSDNNGLAIGIVNNFTFADSPSVLVIGNKAYLRKLTSGVVSSVAQHTDIGSNLRLSFSGFVSLA